MGNNVVTVDRDMRLVWMLARANRTLESDLAKRLKPQGIAVEQFWILEALAQNGPSPMNGLARIALVEPPTLTKIIDRMVASGLVFRAPDTDDRRKINILLSEEGEALYQKLAIEISDQEDNIDQILSDGKLSTLRNILVRLIE
ncbi:MAG: MarR family transcriptional regulator [Pseudomonadota bacterium]